VKYFIVQSLGSNIFLMRFLIGRVYGSVYSLLIVTAMLLKLGCPPFHYWFMSVVKRSDLNIIFLLRTAQKLIPLIFLANGLMRLNILYLVITTAAFVIIALINRSVNLIVILGLSSLTNIM